MSSSSDHVENLNALRRLLRQSGIKAKRENGQNFLIDGRVAEDLVAAAHISKGDTVLEIGPGFGAVTGLLREIGAKVIAVELDQDLAGHLKEQFANDHGVQIIHSDILKLNVGQIVEDGAYKLVSSLPFNITSLVLRNFLERQPRPTEISLLIQKEVAERVTAQPGEMSLLSLSCQYLGNPKIIRMVPSNSFFPEPDVEGAIIHIDVRPLPPDDQREQFFRVARIGFSARRKTLANNLQAGLKLSREKIHEILRKTEVEPMSRPQELSVEDWKRLSENLV